MSAIAQEHQMLEPRDAAELLLCDFRLVALDLCYDRTLQEDLVQEMALAALKISGPHTRAYYLQLGRWRAKTYLRRFGDPVLGSMELE